MQPTRERLAVIGGGWAGLAAAITLTAANRQVVLFESARQLGGRARGVPLQGHMLDNGQHLLVGAYQATLGLLTAIGISSEQAFRRTPLDIACPPDFHLRLPRLVAPLHLAWGLLRAQGVPWAEKWNAARFMQDLKAARYRLPHDTTVADWLDRFGQRGVLRQRLWDPLCLAALNTPPEKASAQIFANVLRDSLGGARAATDFLIPRTDLGSLLPEPARVWLQKRGTEVRLSTRVTALTLHQPGGISPISVLGPWGEETFDQVILATPPHAASPLLPDCEALSSLKNTLNSFRYEPIATAYLGYPEPIGLPTPIEQMPGPLGQWLFDRRDCGNPGVLAVVLSAHGDWESLDNDTLALRLDDEIRVRRPLLPKPLWHRVIREQRATFACTPHLTRPTHRTALPELWLAGDYTAGDYPATLEGAVRSGIAAAHELLST